jgi:hypothetical protein
MKSGSQEHYEEIIDCHASKDEGLVFIKVVATPYGDPVEFNTEEAREFANRILAAIQEVDSGWAGISAAPGSDA